MANGQVDIIGQALSDVPKVSIKHALGDHEIELHGVGGRVVVEVDFGCVADAAPGRAAFREITGHYQDLELEVGDGSVGAEERIRWFIIPAVALSHAARAKLHANAAPMRSLDLALIAAEVAALEVEVVRDGELGSLEVEGP